MGMPMIQMSSESNIPIEQSFKVFAGPGAGKTHWLVNHIKNVLTRSERLGKNRKIVCITYTNVAVGVILGRLGREAVQVEVSTIHSFLYKHIIKPYISFIASDYSLNLQKIDGHDDTILSSYSFLDKWKKATGQLRITDNTKIIKAIRDSRWRFDKSGDLIFRPSRPHKICKYNIKKDSYDEYSIKNTSYYEYKIMSWERGVIHHDDILFFSYQLICKYPFILKILRAKFPYFFVDEFQDTNPIQTEILKRIGQEETIVGVIGDQAQSIYDFQGAEPAQFRSFYLENMVSHKILENHRSSDQIVQFLNNIRQDFQQTSSGRQGQKPILIIGEVRTALNNVRDLCNNEEICCLSRDNITLSILKKISNIEHPGDNLLDELYKIDSNTERRDTVLACIRSLELSISKEYKEAIKILEKLDIVKRDRKQAIKYLKLLVDRYSDIKDMSLMDFYYFIKNNIDRSLSKFANGGIKKFYEQYAYEQLAVCVKMIDDNNLNRTIHKAKGDEFDNVFLILKDSKKLSFIFKPELDQDQEHRINYVAISRAKKRLFISVPSIDNIPKKHIDSISDFLDIVVLT
jgi:DNA helicase-2/ATP-dependent DNA helicase PcrA